MIFYHGKSPLTNTPLGKLLHLMNKNFGPIECYRVNKHFNEQNQILFLRNMIFPNLPQNFKVNDYKF